MKNQKYTIIGIIGLLLWLGETWYFGWNKTPKSVAEQMFDSISVILMSWGIIGDLLRNIKFVKEVNISTNEVKLSTKED